MKSQEKKGGNFLFWKPRILGIVYVAVLAFFSLEVFTYGYGPQDFIYAFFLRLTPALVVVFILLIAWRWEEIGGILFVLLGITLLYRYGSENLLTNFIIAAPLLLVGALFIANSLMGNKFKHLKERIVEVEKTIGKEVKILEEKAKCAVAQRRMAKKPGKPKNALKRNLYAKKKLDLNPKNKRGSK